MSSLLGSLASRFSPGSENLATEALAYVLGRSPAARSAMSQVAKAVGLELPELGSFRTQYAGEDRSIPDLAGFDASGKAVLLIESKFWAGLTVNQPAAYLERLPQSSLGLLLFVVPRRRVNIIWPDLAASSARAGLHLPNAVAHGDELLSAELGHRSLAVTSWNLLLDVIEAKVRAAQEVATLSDIAQLRGLCEYMDATGYVPTTTQELTNIDVPRRLIVLADLVQEVCNQAVAAGLAGIEGLRPTHSWYGAGRYVRLAAAGGWIGIDHRYWARYGAGPLWIVFSPTEFGRGREVLSALSGWLSSNPTRAFDADGSAAIPLRITPYATRDVVIDDLLSQIAELRELLNSAQANRAAEPIFDGGNRAPL